MPWEGLEESMHNVIRGSIGKLIAKQFEDLDLKTSDILDRELIIGLLAQDFWSEMGRQYG